MSSGDDEASGPTLGLGRLPQPGELFADRYLIERYLGRGGMGAVFAAHDRKVGDKVALKILGTDDLITAPGLERFRREVRLARSIGHPNVARVFDLGDHDGLHYLTMELVVGRDLRALLEAEKRLPPPRALSFLLPVLDGLAAAHRAGVVHRDLKPENVLLSAEGRVVLTDFGIARAEDDVPAIHRTAGPIGTPAYMAPEQLLGGAVDARTDIYAAGVLLYEALTGRLPFEGPTPIAIALARLDQEPSDPRQHAAMPDGLAELVLRCLARAPADRPAGAVEIAEALAPFAAGGSTGEVRPPLLRSLPPDRGSPSHPALDRTIAVLPFRYRGAPDHDWAGDALTEEIVDVLSRTRRLRVLSAGATEPFRDRRDPRDAGRELGADAIVDGTLQWGGDRVRITARLCDARTGEQLWNERFEGPTGDVLELSEQLALRIAESLRLELETQMSRGDASVEAVEAYLRARGLMRRNPTTTGEALELLQRSIEEAPGFVPSIASYAIASVRAWFAGSRDRTAAGEAAKAAVSRALEAAPDAAETQLAAAIFESQHGRYREAVDHLHRTLAIAPTCAEAHEYLGSLELEAGQTQSGLRHVQTALQIDPTFVRPLLHLARELALDGQWDEVDRTMLRVAAGLGAEHPLVTVHAARYAAWRGQVDAWRQARGRIIRGQAIAIDIVEYIDEILGDSPPDAMLERMDRLSRLRMSPRAMSARHQYAVESLLHRGPTETAILIVEKAAAGALIDVAWMDRCPVLAPIRNDPRFAEARRQVRERATLVFG